MIWSDLFFQIVYVYTNISHTTLYASWFPWSFWTKNKVETLVSLRIMKTPFTPLQTTHNYWWRHWTWHNCGGSGFIL